MHPIAEVSRMAAPAPLPQALAFDGERLWMTSIETLRIYALDPHRWTVREEQSLGFKCWGMTTLGDGLRLICGEGEDDDRVIRQYVPGHGVKNSGSIPCPEMTGSHLSFDGTHLYVSQWYAKRIVEIDGAGNPLRRYVAPRGIAGHCFANGAFYVLGTDDEENGEYVISRLDPETGASEDLALVPFHARALAYDGARFWTNHREQHQTVHFDLPDAA